MIEDTITRQTNRAHILNPRRRRLSQSEQELQDRIVKKHQDKVKFLQQDLCPKCQSYEADLCVWNLLPLTYDGLYCPYFAKRNQSDV